MTIEKIVRPFQAENPFSARLLPPRDPDANQPSQDEVVIDIESRADTEYIDEPPPASLGFTAEFIEDKKRRITEKVKVENPDDSSQFVNVERIKSTVFRNTKTGEELPFKLDWS